MWLSFIYVYIYIMSAYAVTGANGKQYHLQRNPTSCSHRKQTNEQTNKQYHNKQTMQFTWTWYHHSVQSTNNWEHCKVHWLVWCSDFISLCYPDRIILWRTFGAQKCGVHIHDLVTVSVLAVSPSHTDMAVLPSHTDRCIDFASLSLTSCL